MNTQTKMTNDLERLLTKAQIEVRQATGARAAARKEALEEADDAIVEALKIVRAAPTVPMVKQAPPLKGDEDRDLRLEGKIERRIVWNLIAKLEAAGFEAHEVDDGEEMTRCATALEAMEAIFAVDVATLFVRKGPRGAKRWIDLVLGNGEYVVSDYGISEADGFSALIEGFKPEENY